MNEILQTETDYKEGIKMSGSEKKSFGSGALLIGTLVVSMLIIFVSVICANIKRAES